MHHLRMRALQGSAGLVQQPPGAAGRRRPAGRQAYWTTAVTGAIVRPLRPACASAITVGVTMATLGTRLFTWLRGQQVGADSQGNRYYRLKSGGVVHRDSLRRERRWVLYSDGRDEAS